MSVRDYLDQGNSGGKFCPKCVWYRSTHWGPRLNRKETVSWVHTSITASYCEDCGLLSQAPAAMAFPPRRTVPSNSELKQTLPTTEEEGQKEGKNQRSGSIRSNSVFWIPGDCGPRKVAATVVACTESRQSTFQHGRRRLKGPPSNTPSWMGWEKLGEGVVSENDWNVLYVRQVWLCTPSDPSMQEAAAGGSLWGPGQPGLPGEFHTRQGYIMRSFLTKRKKKVRKEKKKQPPTIVCMYVWNTKQISKNTIFHRNKPFHGLLHCSNIITNTENW